MPKASKKRKEKAADFTKAKLKLGKGKNSASNAVDTSFKARSIALPSQSIAVNKDTSTPRTSRKLSFHDLISQLKHYNVSTRRDAIFGLRELLEANPEMIETGLPTLLNACARLIGDEDANVRKALLSFFQWLLPQIPIEILDPHTPHLLLFTTSAQTHIFPEIRIDATRFIDLFLEIMPSSVVDGWLEGDDNMIGHGSRVLEGYLGILNAGTKFGEDGDSGPVQATSTASVTLSPMSKQAVLKSFAHFLDSAISSQFHPNEDTFTEIPTWYLASAFSTVEAYKSFDRLVHPHFLSPSAPAADRVWKPDIDNVDAEATSTGTFELAVSPLESTWSLRDLSDIVVASSRQGAHDSQSHEVESSGSIRIARLARTLHSTIVSTFLDCAPTVFSVNVSTPPETDIGLVKGVASIAKSLYGALLQKELSSPSGEPYVKKACEDLQQILGYMAPYFPFRIDSVFAKPDIKVQQTFEDLNVIFCELTALLVHVLPSTDGQDRRSDESLHSNPRPRPSRQAFHKRTSQSQGQALASSPLQIMPVCNYVIRLLRSEPSGSQSLGRPLGSNAYIALLPIIWSLLNTGNDFSLETTEEDVDRDEYESLASATLVATVDHALKASASTKKHAIEYTARLILLETDPQYRGVFRIGKTPREVQKVEGWIMQLPKALWELRASNLPATEVVLRVLLRLFQRRSRFLHQQVIMSVHSRIIPYFTTIHPSRGEIPGPYSQLPLSSSLPLRKLALDVAIMISSIRLPDVAENIKLETAVDNAVVGTEDELYWMQIKYAVLKR